MGWTPGNIAKVDKLWHTVPPPKVAKRVLHRLLLLLCWEIWKKKERRRLQGPATEHLSPHCCLQGCGEELELPYTKKG